VSSIRAVSQASATLAPKGPATFRTEPAGGSASASQPASPGPAYHNPGYAYPGYPYNPYQPSLGNGLGQIGRGLWEIVSWTACAATVPLRFLADVAVGLLRLTWEALAALGRGLRAIVDPGYGYHPGYPGYPTYPTYPAYPTYPIFPMSSK
jgi:hypothetical protein